MSSKPKLSIKQQKRKIVKELFNFASVAFTLLFINFLTGGYMWAFWPVGFYALSIGVSFIDLMRNIYLEEIDAEEQNYDHYPPFDEEDYLDLEEPPKRKIPRKQTNWNDRDFV